MQTQRSAVALQLVSSVMHNPLSVIRCAAGTCRQQLLHCILSVLCCCTRLEHLLFDKLDLAPNFSSSTLCR